MIYFCPGIGLRKWQLGLPYSSCSPSRMDLSSEGAFDYFASHAFHSG